VVRVGGRRIDDRGHRSWLLFPVVVFAVWRLTHGVVVAVAGGGVLSSTTAFDGQFYLSLLREGYVAPAGGYDEFSNVAFFPGLAWLTATVQLVVRSETAAVLLVSNALALAAFVTVTGACRAWVDGAVARRAVLALSLVPSSYYLWMYYTEALLVACTAGAAWATARERHLLAVPLLVLAATSRTVGVVVGPCLALVRVWRTRRVDGVSLGYVAASAAGLGLVMLRQQVELGDAFGWSRAQEAWGRQLAPPWVPFVGALERLGEPGLQAGVLLDLVVTLAVGAGVVVLAVSAARRHVPGEPVVLTAALWLVPLLSTLLSSKVRFALGAWPLLLLPARWWPAWPWWWRVAVLLASAGLTLVLLVRLACGQFTA
jgi:hypothetical protein